MLDITPKACKVPKELFATLYCIGGGIMVTEIALRITWIKQRSNHNQCLTGHH